MSEEAKIFMQVIGSIATLPKEEQEKISECLDKIKVILGEYTDLQAGFAVAFVGAEIQMNNAGR